MLLLCTRPWKLCGWFCWLQLIQHPKEASLEPCYVEERQKNVFLLTWHLTGHTSQNAATSAWFLEPHCTLLRSQEFLALPLMPSWWIKPLKDPWHPFLRSARNGFQVALTWDDMEQNQQQQEAVGWMNQISVNRHCRAFPAPLGIIAVLLSGSCWSLMYCLFKRLFLLWGQDYSGKCFLLQCKLGCSYKRKEGTCVQFPTLVTRQWFL